MQKTYIIGATVAVVALALLGAGYYFFAHEEKRPPRPKRDPNAWIVPPVMFPMKGKTFVVPEQPQTEVVLDSIAPSAKRDYPMGRFALATGTGMGTLTAIDDFATDVEGGKRVVPIVQSSGGGTGEFYYLAIIDDNGTEFKHTSSVFLGDRLRITGLTRSGNTVTVSYNVHGLNQPMTELPSVSTTAIIDISNATFVQEGRKPWLEASLVVKEFKGRYLWQKTVGDTTVTPSTKGVFGVVFDGSRITLTTDCNDGSSEYTAPTGTSTNVSFGPVAATKKFCNSSEEGPYFEMITSVVSYTEDEVAQTITFSLQDGRTMHFIKEGQTLEFEFDTEEASETVVEELVS